jgi:hypothetical protein
VIALEWVTDIEVGGVAACDQEGGLVLLSTSEITDLAPGT